MVANIATADNGGAIITGNERVLRARLADRIALVMASVCSNP